MASLQARLISSSLDRTKGSPISAATPSSRENDDSQVRLSTTFKSIPPLKLRASNIPGGNLKEESVADSEILFGEMKHRFLRFKKDVYMENMEQSQQLAELQEPKFMMIACGDSRVCPSTILGLQPGEAFTVRNVANLVPPFENGPTETNAALEFAVTSLEVPNILVIGHSRCGGIRALMSLQEEPNSRSFIRSWVTVGRKARQNTESAASGHGFDQQCRYCEKESINHSLQNLLTYPWIEERVAKGTLSLHGGYYDFIDCTFERWTLDYKGRSMNKNARFPVKNREFWS
ncbi:hypothetical protein V2J09_002530 [Rumex salicifolius]